MEYYLHPTTDILEELKGESLNDYILPFQLFKLLHMYTLSDFIAIIPYFIRKIQLKKKKNINEIKKNEDEKVSNDNALIYNDNNLLLSSKKNKVIIKYCLLIVIFDFLSRFARILYSIVYTNQEIDFYSFSYILPF